ncbi:hypothetical protein MPTK1_7g06830 [Marchantia polymorpha subsp. ruderalis]|uniref:Uncharacterized protein n=2 Tax=Marchantia polymorpha TaxID=3197 RepID=A0AAF6BWW3_MARPO|nr:hypothetical protein MARPO_0199s0008 [Marchantia polymorpha]BBN16497.1 hypothetical protein Mp_7g06830 [Marchantia polymorpha subsp. ruderalis]|eukprot:PTQ27418.1 hypothetical protein MARPO_0199s0008 [Marchantia polymorpha]
MTDLIYSHGSPINCKLRILRGHHLRIYSRSIDTGLERRAVSIDHEAHAIASHPPLQPDDLLAAIIEIEADSCSVNLKTAEIPAHAQGSRISKSSTSSHPRKTNSSQGIRVTTDFSAQ